jgi:peptidoglycan-N-acetylglucosamine deacetylase
MVMTGIYWCIGIFFLFGLLFTAFTLFFDQSILVRKDTFWRAETSEKVVALTFDDGPSDIWTGIILDELKKNGIKATFFILGKQAEQFPDLVRRVMEEGHEIGNHSYTHHTFAFQNRNFIETEIKWTEASINGASGITTRYFRPPKGWLFGREKEIIRGLGYRVILWSLSSKDWAFFRAGHIVKRIMRNIRPGAILLFHDGGGVIGSEGGKRTETIKAIPLLVENLKSVGYRFVTIQELINLSEHD